MSVRPFSNEQARLLVNLRQYYEAWLDTQRVLDALPYDLRRKTVAGKAYLYEVTDRGGNGRSLGPFDVEREARFSLFREQKANAKAALVDQRARLFEASRLYRALRLPLLSSDAGPILREADRRRLLGEKLSVVGTNAMAAYAIEAAGFIEAPDETEDFDLAWSAERKGNDESPVWDLLKAVDATFSVNAERDFQARNSKAYEVELLVAPSRLETLPRLEKPRPVPLPEQEWLLLGTPVDQVVGCRDGTPARIVAPDPRWFALHKLWMAAQPKRNPLKRGKDRQQGIALLEAVREAMPQYPLNASFERHLPAELRAIYEAL